MKLMFLPPNVQGVARKRAALAEVAYAVQGLYERRAMPPAAAQVLDQVVGRVEQIDAALADPNPSRVVGAGRVTRAQQLGRRRT